MSSVEPQVDYPGLEQPDQTARLVAELSAAFQTLHDVLKHFVGTVKRFERHARALKAQPPVRPVMIHSQRVPGRGRGRPKGTPNRNRHIFINGHETHS